MKKRAWFIFLTFLFPGVVFANFSDDINYLLQRFFGNTTEKNTTPSSPSSNIPLPKIEVPSNPTDQDVIDFQKKIMDQETLLQASQIESNDAENKLWDIQDQKKTIEHELSLLDQDISLKEDSLQKLEDQKTKWSTELNTITHDKSELEALINARQSEWGQNVIDQTVRNESMSQDETSLVIKWLFSDKKISDILEDQEIQSLQNSQNSKTLDRLDQLKKQLDINEQHAGILFHALENLETNIVSEKRILDDLAEGKANLMAQLSQDENQTQQNLENSRRQEAEATTILQNLRADLEKVKQKIGTNSETALSVPSSEISENVFGIFSFPLKKSMKIDATFHDPAYKEAFGMDHDGVDFFASQGTEIYAPLDGIVKKTVNNGYGYSYLVIDHGHDLYTLYGHLSSILVNEGQSVKQGDLIGKTGGTPGTPGAGYFTAGPHLHFGVFTNGKFVDPMPYLKQ